ncbi:peptidase inhibitor family I36 protein [Cellulomonas sp. NPDC055163]
MKISVKTKVAAALVTAGVAATTILSATSSAASSAPLSLYEHKGFGGVHVSLYSSDSNLWWNKGFGDTASSVKNHSTVAWVLYDDTGYSDRRFCILPGQTISNLGADAWKFNDKISSVKELGTASCAGYPTF